MNLTELGIFICSTMILIPRKLLVYFLSFSKLFGQRRFTILICDTYIQITFNRRYLAKILPIRCKTLYNQSICHITFHLFCAMHFNLPCLFYNMWEMQLFIPLYAWAYPKFPDTIKFDTKITLENCLYHIDDIHYLFTVLHAYTGILDIWYWLLMFNDKMKPKLKT